MAKLGVLVASRIPPPGKLPKRPGTDAPSEGDGDESGADDGDQQAAELDAMREFENAESTEDKAAALKQFIEICKPSGY